MEEKNFSSIHYTNWYITRKRCDNQKNRRFAKGVA